MSRLLLQQQLPKRHRPLLSSKRRQSPSRPASNHLPWLNQHQSPQRRRSSRHQSWNHPLPSSLHPHRRQHRHHRVWYRRLSVYASRNPGSQRSRRVRWRPRNVPPCRSRGWCSRLLRHRPNQRRRLDVRQHRRRGQADRALDALAIRRPRARRRQACWADRGHCPRSRCARSQAASRRGQGCRVFVRPRRGRRWVSSNTGPASAPRRRAGSGRRPRQWLHRRRRRR